MARAESGTQYKYLIQYEGINVLGKETADKNENRINGEVYVKEVLDMDTGEKITNPTPLARYEVGTGALWTYEVEETIDWDQNKPDNGHQVFDSAPSGTGFTFTNNYDPTEGSIQVKKFLYLPMGDDGNPEAYPAVTFKLTRQVSYGDDQDGKPIYELDNSFGTQEVTISSETVQESWKALTNNTDGYVTLYALFENLDLYAPNGREYRYTVIEDRDELKGYETFAVSGNKETPDAVAGEGESWTAQDSTNYPNSGITDGIKIGGLKPTEVTQDSVDTLTPAATFKNQQPTPQEEYENDFTATKVWEDNGDAYGFRPSAEEFQDLSLIHI